MATTIQVSGETRQLLSLLKERENAPNYDLVIKHLLKTHTHMPKSMFGAVKGLRWNKKQDRAEFREL